MAERVDLAGFRLGLLHLDVRQGGAAESSNELTSVLVFNVGNETFAVSVDNTDGVVDCPPLSPLPEAPIGIVGVTSVRGRITIVMDLSFGRGGDGRRRLILLRGDAQLGLLAGRVEGVVGLEPGSIPDRDAGHALLGRTARFEHEGRQVSIIDVEKLSTL